MSDFNEKIIEEFRTNEGKVGGPFEGSPLALLTTIGAKSGRPRTSPVGYVPDGDRVLVIASNAGAAHHPAWYHNLLANPRITVEIGTETYEATAIPAEGEERDRLFALAVEAAPGYGDYQTMTSRLLPVVVLHRTDRASAEARGRAVGEELRRIHGWFRQELATLRDEVSAYLDGNPIIPSAAFRPAPEPAQRLREHCLTFCDALARHHTGEDTVAFPHLRERFPELGEALERLRREHTVVERLRGDLREAVATLGSGDTAGHRPDRLRADIERLASELEAHFDYEEEQLIPALNALTDVPWPRPE
ncbi:nitroreductase/quinone reductase family protein [Actinomadura alba]|uniref:Nitroreductase family deazaflavin-dependent oxidoreductase n=1 Tax=Actinomadura alba TaxID=406431 RepID=A0ABR7LLU9_9ACTN|nr:nitroreductase/quinone reductase family protein [Actinomadura alba]MBC6465830.1 nitroreductase family deazaflavin-dependent oxidoreductase [Actinomadura alba]